MDRYLYMYLNRDEYFVSGPYSSLDKADEVINRLKEVYSARDPYFRLVFYDEHLEKQFRLQDNS